AGAPARRSAPAPRRHGPAAPRRPAVRTPAPPRRVPATALRDPPSVRRPRATHTSTTTHAFRASHSASSGASAGDYAVRPGACYKPPVSYTLEVEGGMFSLLAKRRRAAYGGTVGLEASPTGSGCSCGRDVLQPLRQGRLQRRRE